MPQLMTVPTACDKCGGKLWDNRQNKKNPKAPDFKCRDKACEGVFWPPKPKDNWVWADQAGNVLAQAMGTPGPVAANAKQPHYMGTTGVPMLDEQGAYEAQAVATITAAPQSDGDLALYKKLTAFVLTEIAPYYVQAEIGASPEAMQAAVATLYIQRARR